MYIKYNKNVSNSLSLYTAWWSASIILRGGGGGSTLCYLGKFARFQLNYQHANNNKHTFHDRCILVLNKEREIIKCFFLYI